MATYTVIKSFRSNEKDKPQRNKGAEVELSGKELEFAQENGCVKKVEAPKK
jgi:hypothetical protein